jgi:DNA polymerase-3 subunit beta
MKIEVKQENLNRALAAVSRIASTRGQMPILADILLKTENGKLTIAATNLEIAITEVISVKIEEEGSVAVPARIFAEFVNNLPKIPVAIESDEQKTKISAGGFASTINGGDPEEFPSLPEIENAKEFTIPAAEFRESISTVAPVASGDTTRPILTGIYFYSGEDELIMTATDGYRLAEKKISRKINTDITAIVPASTLMEVSRLISDSEEEITVRLNEEQIGFAIGGISLTSRLIDGKFIDYKQLIPTTTDFAVSVNRSEFVRVVKMAGIFANNSAGSVIMKISSENQQVEVSALASELGENSSAVEADITGNGDGTVVLNSKFLLDALNFVAGEKVKIGFSGKLSPVLITGEKTDYNHIIMPVKS